MDMENGNGDNSIWAFLLFALFANGGMGGCGNRNNDCLTRGDADHLSQNTVEEIRFNELSTQNQMYAIASNQYQQSIFAEICDVKGKIAEGNYATLTAVAEAKYDNALLAKDAEINAIKCCCETQEKMATGFNMLTQQNMQLENQRLRDMYELQLRNCPTPAWITCNPCASSGVNTFNNCGCGF